MPVSPFRIKICGIKSPDDALAAVAAGADALGLNFYRKSKRSIDLEQARNIVEIVQDAATCIALFVNDTTEHISEIAAELRLGGIQLHGDEPPGFLRLLPALPILRARRMDARGVCAVAQDVDACRTAGRLPDAVLVDAAAPGQYGGTGETVSWSDLADYRKWLGDVPLILAGGLTPENVAEAIRTVRPDGVDVASGVEKSPGVKDRDKMRAFVDAAESAFEAL